MNRMASVQQFLITARLRMFLERLDLEFKFFETQLKLKSLIINSRYSINISNDFIIYID